MTIKEFEQGWRHFCNCIDFAHSNLDAEAIRFMIEMHAMHSKIKAERGWALRGGAQQRRSIA